MEVAWWILQMTRNIGKNASRRSNGRITVWDFQVHTWGKLDGKLAYIHMQRHIYIWYMCMIYVQIQHTCLIYYRLQCSKWRIKMSGSNILLGLQSKLWKKCTKDSAGKGLFVKYKVYVHVSVATISTCRNSLDFTFLPIFTFISGILAATCNLKIMKTGPPRQRPTFESRPRRVFFRRAQWKTELKWIPSLVVFYIISQRLQGTKKKPYRVDWEKPAKFRDDKLSIRAP